MHAQPPNPRGRPTFSVVTANFNSGDKLAATVASVREQASDVEHWVIDGVSTDGSLELARRLADASGGVLRVNSGPDRGVYDALNKGIAAAQGRYLYFLGAGDVMRPDALRRVAAALPADDRTLVYGDTFWNGRRYGGPFTKFRLRRDNVPHQAAFYGREVFDRVGTYDLKYRVLADYALNLRVFADRRVAKRYVDVIVADYEGSGLSDTVVDTAFVADYKRLMRRLGIATTVRIELDRVARRVRRAGRAVLGRPSSQVRS